MLTPFVISLAIGIPTFLFGCNLNLSGPGSCPLQTVLNGTVTNTWTQIDTCTGGCIVYSSDSSCAAYEYYPCEHLYGSFVLSNNHTCSALLDFGTWWVGQTTNIAVDKEGSCSVDLDQERNVWIVGVTFLSVAAAIALASCAMQIWPEKFCNPRQVEQSPRRPEIALAPVDV